MALAVILNDVLAFGISLNIAQRDRVLRPLAVPRMLKGMYQERSSPKNLELRRACPESGHVPRILKGMSPERACLKNVKGHVPRAVLSQELRMSPERACPKNVKGHVTKAGTTQ